MTMMNVFTMESSRLLNELHAKMGGELGKSHLFIPSPSPLLFQAHVDTLRKVDNITISRNGNIIRAKNSILGADDRAGVFALVKLQEWCALKAIEQPNLLFTDGEESGGWGMLDFLETKESVDFKHIRLAVAFDRQGANEYVTYNALHDKVRKYIESFGFVPAHGTFSDITLFTDDTEIPSVNLSVGYYNQHSKSEELHFDELCLTIERAKLMIKQPIGKFYRSKQEKWKGNNWAWRDDPTWDYKAWAASTQCDWCGSMSGKYMVQEHGYVEKTLVCEKCACYFHGDDSYQLQLVQ
jgi:hypothetical protein